LSAILVVDDEPAIRTLLRWIFETAGHEVEEAGDGTAGLASVARSAPDLVVTDMTMPVMGGAELIRRLREDPATARIPILAVSGDQQLAAGADAVVRKPFVSEVVLAVSDGLLTGKV
jgi:CheY-like chemotaxis protein